MNTNEVKSGFSRRAGMLVSKGVKLPKSYDINMHVLKLESVFMGDIDPLTNAKYTKARENLEKILTALETESNVPVLLVGEIRKSDEQIIKYAKRYARLQFEKMLLQQEHDRRMSEYNVKLARVEALVTDCRSEFVAQLGRISSAEIEAETATED